MFGRVSIRHVAFAGGKSEETLPSKESCSKAAVERAMKVQKEEPATPRSGFLRRDRKKQRSAFVPLSMIPPG